jgi:hypothetical protein
MAPGPELAAVLATIDRSAVAAEDLHDLLAARFRLLTHVQGQLLADVWETARTVGQPAGSLSRSDEVTEHSGTEIGWTLAWTESYAFAQVLLGRALLGRLPAVWAAMLAGRIDAAKANAFVDALADLDEQTARAVADRLLDRADRWTLAQLRDRLRYHVERANPADAKDRYQRRVVDRDVSVRPGMHGTACLSGYNLPTDKALAAYDRLDRLARAAKSAGDTRNLAQLRADAHLDLLAGTPFQLSPSIDPITAEADTRHPRDPDDDPDSLSETGNDDGIDTTSEEPIGSGVFGDADVPEADSRSETGNRDGAGTTGEEPIGSGVFGDADVPDADSRSETGNRHGIDTTGEEPIGYGVFGDADVAEADSRLETGNRDAVDTKRDGGAAVAGGDRCVCGGIQPQPRRGVVDIQIKLSTLAGLDHDPALIPGWGPVLADIARQISFDRKANPAWKWSATDEDGNLLHHGHTRRRPTATEAAFVRARDRTCRSPGCRRNARRCDLDHRHDYAKGGCSHRGNIEARCPHHHRFKTRPGHQLTRLHRHITRWTTPNGRNYDIGPDKDIIIAVERT